LSDSVEIFAACDANNANLQKAGAMYNILHLFSDYDKLLSMPEIDFVVVALPNYLHAPVSIEAMKRGKHVHCEKPMSISYAEAKEMADTALQTQKVLMVGLNNRFLPQSRYMKELVQNNFFGDVYHVNAFWKRRAGLPASPWYMDKTFAGGGCLIDIGLHMLDLVMYLLDHPAPVNVSASSYKKLSGSDDRAAFTYGEIRLPDGIPFDTEDLVCAQILFENKLSLSLECSWASFTEREQAGYEIYGTRGGVKYIKYPGEQPQLTLFTLDHGRQVSITPKFEPVVFDPLEFTHFIECVKTNTAPKIACVESCLHTMRLIDGIYKSAKEGKPILF
jgi:predicted dehydrogenase